MEPQLLPLLTREGVLIKVSIRFWRGCKKLKAEDIGLNSSDVSNRLISLGHKRLLPKESTQQLSLIEGRAHALIEGNTFPFLNGLAHFLPNARSTNWRRSFGTPRTSFSGATLRCASPLQRNGAPWRRGS
jgi:hypothetical protein